MAVHSQIVDTGQTDSSRRSGTLSEAFAGVGAVEVRELSTRDGGEERLWNDYLTKRTGGAPLSCRLEWESVLAVYGLSLSRLMAVRNGQAAGLLALVPQHSLLTGHQLVSLPWFDFAGILADDEQARAALVARALNVAQECGAHWVQLRQRELLDLSPHVRTDKVLMRLKLESDPQVLWSRLHSKVRNQVRKGEKCGLTVRSGGAEHLPAFFRVYSENMRDLGSPSHSLCFFRAVCDAFPDDIRLAVASLKNQVVGAGITIANGRCLEIPWASSLRRFNQLCVNHALYWHVLEQACRDGFQWFHFGRSTVDSGTYAFKKQWGAEPVPLYWYFLSHDNEKARRAAQPIGETHGLGVRLWTKLPLFVTRRLGPLFISQIP